jgi:hypothetical protein
MTIPNDHRARLSIEVEPELRERIEIAAAARNISVRDYVEGVLHRSLALEEDRGQRKLQPESGAMPQLTEEEQARGLQALADLERYRHELAAVHGTLRPASWELLNASRDERTRELMRAVEE